MEQKAFRGKLRVAFGMEQEGSQGIWNKELPSKEELELVKRSSDLSFNALSMRRVYHAGRSGN